MKKLLLFLGIALLMPLSVAAQVPYAVLSDDFKTLTFYYGDMPANGLSVGPFEYESERWGGHAGDITAVVFDDSFADCLTLTSTSYWFYGCTNLASITGIENLKTSQVRDMGMMFEGCSSLTSLDLGTFDTGKVSSLYGMFRGCSSLTSLNLKGTAKRKSRALPYVDIVSNGDLEGTDVSCFYVKQGGNTDAVPVEIADGVGKDGSRGIKVTAAAGQTNAWDTQLWLNLPETLEPNAKFKISFDFYSSSPFWISTECHAAPQDWIWSPFLSQFYSYGEWQHYTYEGTVSASNSGGGRMHSIGFDFGNTSDAAIDFFFDNFTFEVLSTTEEDVDAFDTHNVTDMAVMFSGCSSLTNLNVSHFDTRNVINMGEMFMNCSKLSSLDVSHFNTSNVRYMPYMFSECSGLSSLDVSNFDTRNVINMLYMFQGCSNLKSLDLSAQVKATVRHEPWVDLVTNGNMEGTEVVNFITKVPGGSAEPSTIVDGVGKDDSRGIKVSTVAGQANAWDTQFWINLPETLEPSVHYKFSFDYRSSAPFSFYPEAHSNPGSFLAQLFWWNNDTQEYFNTINTTTEWKTFTYEGGIYADLNGNTTMHSIAFDLGNTTGEDIDIFFDNFKFEVLEKQDVNVSAFSTAKVEYMSGMFADCTNLETIYAAEDWNTQQVTESEGMFSNCTKLKGGEGTTYNAENPADYSYALIDQGITRPGYFTLKVTEESDEEPYAVVSADGKTLTFYYDNQRTTRGGTKVVPFTSEQFRGWNVSAATIATVAFDESFDNYTDLSSTAYWFSGFAALSSITGMEYLHTDNVITMCNMFAGCSSLENIDLSHFVTDNVTDMFGMFENCSSLTSLDLSTLNTQKVTTMGEMLKGCSKIECLDLSHFSTESVSVTYYMFENCISLHTIYCNDQWSAYSSMDMFKGCTLLPGYDEYCVDGYNARPIASGGYFTPTLTAVETTVETAAEGKYWMTYYTDKRNFKADANTKVFTATLNDDKTELILHEVTNKIVPAGNAVILRSTVEAPQLATTTESGSASDFTENVLQGSETLIYIENDGNTYYTLADEGDVIGFYRYAGLTLGARKAYLTLASTARMLTFGEETTGIAELSGQNGQQPAAYFDLQGRRVEQPAKGLYIVDGKKVLINQ